MTSLLATGRAILEFSLIRAKNKLIQLMLINSLFSSRKIKKGKGGAGRGRKPGPKPKGFKNPVKTGPKVGKVRTLLPKYRYVPVPLEPPGE